MLDALADLGGPGTAWAALPPAPAPHSFGAAAVDPRHDTTLWCTGGQGPGCTLDCFDFAAQTWQPGVSWGGAWLKTCMTGLTGPFPQWLFPGGGARRWIFCPMDDYSSWAEEGVHQTAGRTKCTRAGRWHGTHEIVASPASGTSPSTFGG